MAAVEHLYRYPLPSALLDEPEGLRLRLAATEVPMSGLAPLFFRGRFAEPRLAADLLLALVRVVQARYHVPAAMVERLVRESDPVVTCGEERVRFEGFSACCGVYARVDFLPEGLEGASLACGTTNVDFNPAMRTALTRVGRSGTLRLTVGAGEVEVEAGGGSVVEKRVPLPLRWLKGLMEVQVVQAGLTPCLETPGVEARRFLRALPRQGTGSRPAWVTPSGRGLRVSQVESSGAVRVAGLERLRTLEEISPSARWLRVWSGPGGSAWELDFLGARFYLVLSPETWRGFSGEGGALHALARSVPEDRLERLTGALDWSPRLDEARLAAGSGLPSGQVRPALARLAASGRVGFDLAEGGFFRRELPFDLSRVDALNPRLREARALAASGGVRIESGSPERIEAWVRGSEVEHRVRLDRSGFSCTCPWFGRHGRDRGPCRHVLAVQLVLESNGDG